MGLTNQPPDLLPGTLDMLILRTLLRGELHGYGIVERLRQVSDNVLQVGESSLYPALQRLLLNGWVKAEWRGASPGGLSRVCWLGGGAADGAAARHAGPGIHPW